MVPKKIGFATRLDNRLAAIATRGDFSGRTLQKSSSLESSSLATAPYSDLVHEHHDIISDDYHWLDHDDEDHDQLSDDEGNEGNYNESASPVPNIIKDLIKLSEEQLNIYRKQIHLEPRRSYKTLSQRYHDWYRRYNDLKLELDEQLQDEDYLSPNQVYDPAYTTMRLSAMDHFKENYALLEAILSKNHHQRASEKQRTEPRSEDSLSKQSKDTISPPLRSKDNSLASEIIVPDGDQLMESKTAGYVERVDFMYELIALLMDQLEHNLSVSRELHRKFLESIGRPFEFEDQVDNNDDEEDQDPYDELVVDRDGDKFFDSQDKFSTEDEKIMMKELNRQERQLIKKLRTQNDNDTSKAVECARNTIENGSYESTFSRLKTITKKEIAGVISQEVMAMAQLYFLTSMGLHQKHVIDAYLSTVKGRLVGRALGHILQNFNVMRIADMAYGKMKKDIVDRCAPPS